MKEFWRNAFYKKKGFKKPREKRKTGGDRPPKREEFWLSKADPQKSGGEARTKRGPEKKSLPGNVRRIPLTAAGETRKHRGLEKGLKKPTFSLGGPASKR